MQSMGISSHASGVPSMLQGFANPSRPLSTRALGKPQRKREIGWFCNVLVSSYYCHILLHAFESVHVWWQAMG